MELEEATFLVFFKSALENSASGFAFFLIFHVFLPMKILEAKLCSNYVHLVLRTLKFKSDGLLNQGVL